MRLVSVPFGIVVIPSNAFQIVRIRCTPGWPCQDGAPGEARDLGVGGRTLEADRSSAGDGSSGRGGRTRLAFARLLGSSERTIDDRAGERDRRSGCSRMQRPGNVEGDRQLGPDPDPGVEPERASWALMAQTGRRSCESLSRARRGPGPGPEERARKSALSFRPWPRLEWREYEKPCLYSFQRILARPGRPSIPSHEESRG